MRDFFGEDSNGVSSSTCTDMPADYGVGRKLALMTRCRRARNVERLHEGSGPTLLNWSLNHHEGKTGSPYHKITYRTKLDSCYHGTKATLYINNLVTI